MDKSYFQKIHSLYADYIRWSGELMASFGGVKIFSQMFTGGGQYKNREEHNRFFADCGALAGECFRRLGEGSGCDGEAAEILRYVLVDCHSESDEWAEWMLLAAEKHFIPFLDLLDREQAAALYEPYRRLRRRSRGLPPQDEIAAKLKKICK